MNNFIHYDLKPCYESIVKNKAREWADLILFACQGMEELSKKKQSRKPAKIVAQKNSTQSISHSRKTRALSHDDEFDERKYTQKLYMHKAIAREMIRLKEGNKQLKSKTSGAVMRKVAQ